MRVIKFALTMVFAVAGLVLLAEQRAAAGQGIPLKALEGNYSLTNQGPFSLCLNPATFAGVNCAKFSGPLIVPQTYLNVGGLTRDDDGNSCGTLTAVSSSLPVDNTLPFVDNTARAVGKISTYDSVTGTGEISFTNYSGGKCNGSTFDKTDATETGTAVAHFAVSNGGKRMDLVYTSVIAFVSDTTGDVIGDFSLSGTMLKQDK